MSLRGSAEAKPHPLRQVFNNPIRVHRLDLATSMSRDYADRLTPCCLAAEDAIRRVFDDNTCQYPITLALPFNVQLTYSLRVLHCTFLHPGDTGPGCARRKFNESNLLAETKIPTRAFPFRKAHPSLGHLGQVYPSWSKHRRSTRAWTRCRSPNTGSEGSDHRRAVEVSSSAIESWIPWQDNLRLASLLLHLAGE